MTHSPLILLLFVSLSAAPAKAEDPSLGIEDAIPATEAADTQAIASELVRTLQREHDIDVFRGIQVKVHRDAHPKAHGCVKADFSVLPGLSPELAQGIFSRPGPLKAWIRFSNGSPKEDKPDSAGNARGMAIKVIGVPGPKLLNPRLNATEEKSTQDFLLSNHPVFFIRNPREYVTFMTRKAVFFLEDGLFHALHTTKILDETSSEQAENLFELQYYSQVPYRLGSESTHRAVKYRAEPVNCADGTPIVITREQLRAEREKHIGQDNFLRDEMINSVNAGDSCFNFEIQLQKDGMSLEDSTIEWSETDSQFVPVAKIRITKAGNENKVGLMNQQRTEFCEDIAMTPWHGIPAHRPLSGISRVRKTVYQVISGFRHKMNGVARFEPTGTESF